METLGAWEEEAQSCLQPFGRWISTVTGERRATEFLWQRMSAALQGGNADCVLGTVDFER